MSSTLTNTTEFTCQAEDANAVFLAGTFNDWQPDATLMLKDADGNWKANLDLPPGRHEFKFVADGQWCCKPGCQVSGTCPDCVENAFGTMNRFVDVD